MFKKILLKFSGEALAGNTESIIDPQIINRIAHEIGSLTASGIQVGVVVGGGNLFRGQEHAALGINRITADHMGMLGTVINALALRDACENAGFKCSVMSAIPINGIAELYDRRKALKKLQKGQIVIFAAGTGNPLLTTDSAASLRAIELGMDMLIKATNVDGIYDRDPHRYKDAKLYHKLSFQEVLAKELGVMDLAAFCQCRDHKMKIVVFNYNKAGALEKIVKGENEGTVVE